MVGWLLAVEPVRELGKHDKARLLIAFLAALILCMLLLFLIWLMARIVRRHMNQPLPQVSTPLPEDHWKMQPLEQAIPSENDEESEA